MTERPSVLSLEHIEKSFGGVHALSGANLDARHGEILGLCGENGAGKSTLLKVLSGVYPHGTYRGRIVMGGREVAFDGTTAARKSGIGIVHQELMLIGELTVAQNLALGRETTRAGLLDDDALEARAHELLVRFGVRSDLHPRQKLADLGIGLWQIVEIVRALGDARTDGDNILILDEPTAALTAREAERLFVWLRDLAQAGTTCIYVSHRMDEVFAVCDRVTVLRDGKTVGTVNVPESNPAELVAMMVGRAVSDERNAVAHEAGTRALAVKNLYVEDGAGRAVLHDISLEVARGEMVALAGAMGAGRTALLSTIFGAARGKVAGEIRIDDAPSEHFAQPADAIARGVALVPEDRKRQGVVLGLTIDENMSLVPQPPHKRASLLERIGFIDEAKDELETKKRIQELRIRGTAESPVGTLSGGNQQKVAVGKWLKSPPRVLLLDEPTRGVDIGAREEIYAILDELRRKGTAILFASSDPAEVERLGDRVVVLRHGRVVATLDRSDATQQRIVELTTGAGTPSTSAQSSVPHTAAHETNEPCNP